jgi:hypothetical protein
VATFEASDWVSNTYSKEEQACGPKEISSSDVPNKSPQSRIEKSQPGVISLL